MNRYLMFIFFVVLLFSLIFMFEWIIYKRWKRRINNLIAKRIFTITFWFIILSTNFLFLFLFFNRKNIYFIFEGYLKHLYFFYLSWNYAFFFGFLLWIILLASFKLIAKVYKIIMSNLGNQNTLVSNKDRISRKAVLAGMGGIFLDSIPFIGTGFNLFGIYKGSKEFQVFRKEIKISNLHKNFLGYKIVQISDIHIGSLINEEYLKPTLEIIKSLKPDCIVVTGDILDNSTQYLNIVGWYFYRLNQICPVFAILGNHDHINKPNLLVKTLEQSNTKVLINEFGVIKRNRSYLYMIGLDYPMFAYRNRSKISEKFFDRVYDQIPDKESPIIVLNHHPSEFEYLKNKRINLVLSGHTHGGQIVFSQNRNSSLSLGSNFLKYYIDHYQENQVHLYVNRGLGHWFPLRINCPPEITLIELI